MMFVTRIFFDSYMDFFVYDLINGLSHGHAPSKCQCCGRYFLTTTGHSPKYCDGMAPQNPTMTCRQYGAKQGRKEDNPNHPIYRLFSTRTNTIRKHAERKKIDAETRAAALELAREYRDKALMDRAYFLNGYAQDMELENIYAEAKKRLELKGGAAGGQRDPHQRKYGTPHPGRAEAQPEFWRPGYVG